MTSAATTETYPITGIPTNARPQIDPVPLRPEINAWVSNPANADQVALFVLALDKFQKLDYEDKLSYFKVCGIHGLPRAPWDQPPNVDGGYYCAHGSILFPTWHRPYLLLFEQRIYEIMINDIIPLAKPQDQPRLLDLAKSWRFPYWDWAVVNVDVPDIVRRPFLPEVISKSLAGVFGVNVQKDPETGAIQPNNPLYSFRTPEPMGKYGIPVDNSQPYDIAKSTSRYPPRYKQGDQSAETQWTNGVQNNDDVTKALRVQQDDDSPNHPSALGGSVYRLLTPGQYKYYGDFATVTYNPPSGSSSAKADAGAPGERENLKANFRPPSSHTSLESVHNTAHHSIGGDFTLPGFGTGHMADQSIAAFDPIFWLHHCHIDRLLAIWQTLNPDLWLLDADVERSARGKMSEKALSPFHADKKRTSYTSNKVREWTQFGYTYPELQYWLPQYRDGNGKFSQEKYVADVSRQVKALYAPTTGTSTGYDYVVNVEYDRFALGGQGFVVNVLVDGIRAGQVANFSSRIEQTGCENCQEQREANAIAVGQVDITPALHSAVRKAPNDLPSLEPKVVKGFLQEAGKLSWTVTKSDGEVVPLGDIPSVKVSVAQGTVQHFADPTKLSIFSFEQVLF